MDRGSAAVVVAALAAEVGLAAMQVAERVAAATGEGEEAVAAAWRRHKSQSRSA